MKVVLLLSDRYYRAKPLRRVYVEKKGKNKKRPLRIPTICDRAMQTLYVLAFEPIAEVTGDHKSFEFRKGRSTKDACEQIFNIGKKMLNHYFERNESRNTIKINSEAKPNNQRGDKLS